MTRRVTPGLAGGVLAGALLVGQLCAALPTVAESLRGARLVYAGVVHPQPEGFAGHPAFAALVDMLPLLADVPEDARVLLVVGTAMPFAYDFHVLPRPLDVLLRVEDKLVARALRRLEAPSLVLDWLQLIEERRMRLTPERLAEELPAHDVLLTLMIEHQALPLGDEPTARLEPLGAHGQAALYRIVPR